MPHTYEYPRPALTVDCVVFGLDEQDLKVLLVRRDLPPFEGRWALPGGFVHMEESVDDAARRLKGKVRYEPIGFELLPPKFTLSQLQRLYETVLERSLDKRNFRKKILSMGVLVETDEIQQDVAHRAARLYRFDEDKYRRLRK